MMMMLMMEVRIGRKKEFLYLSVALIELREKQLKSLAEAFYTVCTGYMQCIYMAPAIFGHFPLSDMNTQTKQ